MERHKQRPIMGSARLGAHMSIGTYAINVRPTRLTRSVTAEMFEPGTLIQNNVGFLHLVVYDENSGENRFLSILSYGNDYHSKCNLHKLMDVDDTLTNDPVVVGKLTVDLIE